MAPHGTEHGPASQAGSPPLAVGDNSVSRLPRRCRLRRRSRSAAVWLPEESQTSDLVLSGKAPPSPLRFPWLPGSGGCQDGDCCHVAGLRAGLDCLPRRCWWPLGV